MIRGETFDFDERDHALLDSFAAQAAVAVEDARLYAAEAEARDAAEAAMRVKSDFLGHDEPRDPDAAGRHRRAERD